MLRQHFISHHQLNRQCIQQADAPREVLAARNWSRSRRMNGSGKQRCCGPTTVHLLARPPTKRASQSHPGEVLLSQSIAVKARVGLFWHALQTDLHVPLLAATLVCTAHDRAVLHARQHRKTYSRYPRGRRSCLDASNRHTGNPHRSLGFQLRATAEVAPARHIRGGLGGSPPKRLRDMSDRKFHAGVHRRKRLFEFWEFGGVDRLV